MELKKTKEKTNDIKIVNTDLTKPKGDKKQVTQGSGQEILQPSTQTFSDGVGNQVTVNVVDSSGKVKSDGAIQADINAKLPDNENGNKRFDQISNNAIKSALHEKRAEVKLFKSVKHTAASEKVVHQAKSIKR
jgi:hypothetical protein